MTTVAVDLPGSPYAVSVGSGLLARSSDLLPEPLRRRRCGVIADTTVAALHGDAVLAGLRSSVQSAELITFPAGEGSKCMAVASALCERLAMAGIDRSGFIAALGGGVAGDLAGFVAAIHYRGIPVVQFPTTIVAQVDSSVGGKTGVNSPAGKNLIGAFHHPSAVIADTDTLATLPPREYHAGFAEIIKHAAIRSPALLERLTSDPPIDLPGLIAENVRIKADIVAADPEERSGLRALLNFGHTIGHAIEAAAGYGRYLHGEAISLGLVAALRLSVAKAGLSATDAARVMRLLELHGLPTRLADDVSADGILDLVANDKKFEEGAVRFVLLRAPGEAYVSREVLTTEIREEIERLRLSAPELA